MIQDKKVAELEQLEELEVEREFENEQNKNEQQLEFEFEQNESRDEELIQKKKKRDLKIELALFFVLGLLIGITLKTEAVKKITIGFNDYQVPVSAQRYDLEKIKSDLIREAAKQQALQESAPSETQTSPNQQ